jgi:phosphoribosyl-AMP cyclohydrolase / phosphoribosyl-ATP pyrophosphohydrolase
MYRLRQKLLTVSMSFPAFCSFFSLLLRLPRPLQRHHRRLATFYSRSRKGRWCKGETSGHFIKVLDVYLDCDRDSLVYLSDPIGPACHTNAPTCYFTRLAVANDAPGLHEAGSHHSRDEAPMTTLYSLERTIRQRKEAAAAPLPPGAKPSWTARLAADPVLLCKKVREEAGELCETLENEEGRERTASEAADLIYHAMVLLSVQGVGLDEVCGVLRSRFGTSGVEEKAARPPKAAA